MSLTCDLTADQLAEVLVVSALPAGSRLSDAELAEVVTATITQFHGIEGCRDREAEMYGNDFASIELKLPWAHQEALRHPSFSLAAF
jgi:hypothetical protein